MAANLIIVDNFASLFNCTMVGPQDKMKAPLQYVSVGAQLTMSGLVYHGPTVIFCVPASDALYFAGFSLRVLK